MKKLMALVGVAAMMSIAPATPAFAEGGSIGSNGECYGIVPDVNGSLEGGVQVVGTYTSRSTKSGITNFTCHFDLTDDEAPAKTVKASSFPCQTPLGATTNSRINASPGGRMVMNCTIKSSASVSLVR